MQSSRKQALHTPYANNAGRASSPPSTRRSAERSKDPATATFRVANTDRAARRVTPGTEERAVPRSHRSTAARALRMHTSGTATAAAVLQAIPDRLDREELERLRGDPTVVCYHQQLHLRSSGAATVLAGDPANPLSLQGQPVATAKSKHIGMTLYGAAHTAVVSVFRLERVDDAQDTGPVCVNDEVCTRLACRLMCAAAHPCQIALQVALVCEADGRRLLSVMEVARTVRCVLAST